MRDRLPDVRRWSQARQPEQEDSWESGARALVSLPVAAPPRAGGRGAGGGYGRLSPSSPSSGGQFANTDGRQNEAIGARNDGQTDGEPDGRPDGRNNGRNDDGGDHDELT